jgi:hypothetical protein
MIEGERQTATEVGDARRERAIDAYQREIRFRGIVQAIVHGAVAKSGVNDSHDGEVTWEARDVARFAEDVAAQVLQMVYEEDFELRAQKEIADRFRKAAQDALLMMPRQPFFVAPPPPPATEQT